MSYTTELYEQIDRLTADRDALVKALEQIAALADEGDEWDGRDKFRDCQEIAHAALFNMRAAEARPRS